MPDYMVLNGKTYVPEVKKYTGWRCLHVPEGGYVSDNEQPEVRPGWKASDPRAEAPPVGMTSAIQLLDYRINLHNPLYTGLRWRSVHTGGRAFNNNQGYGMPGDPRADFVNRLDMTAELPKLMKAIICGGMFIRGEVSGPYLRCVPGIHAADANRPMPTVSEILARNWYFVAVTQNDQNIYNFPQGQGQHVRCLYVLREPVVYPLSWFAPWESDDLPDPLKLYQ